MLVLILIGVLGGAFAVNQFIIVRKAHSSFDNYYAFRGCTQLLKKTNSYGLCKIQSGKTIKLVEFQGKWYLNGDLPTCFFTVCF